jgi:hypothetical protein
VSETDTTESLFGALYRLVGEADLDTVVATLADVCERRLKLDATRDGEMISYWDACARAMQRALKTVVDARKTLI